MRTRSRAVGAWEGLELFLEPGSELLVSKAHGSAARRTEDCE
jgi:hypothetical protein